VLLQLRAAQAEQEDQQQDQADDHVGGV
jgi:hypothetical protein